MSLWDHLEALAASQVWFVIENVFILTGYLFVAIKVAPILPVRLITRVGAVAFFMTCAFTHVEQVLHTLYSRGTPWGELASDVHMQFVHIPQAIAVWTFVSFFYFDLKRLRFERGTVAVAQKEPAL